MTNKTSAKRKGIKRASLVGGEVFSRLTVVDFSHRVERKDGKAGERVMNCLCVCGEKIKARTSNLYSGNTKSCGCFHSQQTIKSNTTREDGDEINPNTITGKQVIEWLENNQDARLELSTEFAEHILERYDDLSWDDCFMNVLCYIKDKAEFQ